MRNKGRYSKEREEKDFEFEEIFGLQKADMHLHYKLQIFPNEIFFFLALFQSSSDFSSSHSLQSLSPFVNKSMMVHQTFNMCLSNRCHLS